MKMPKFGTENALLSIFGLEFLKTIVLFENSNFEFVKHESLTHTVNFDIGSAFSKGLGPPFLEVRFRVRVCSTKYAFTLIR